MRKLSVIFLCIIIYSCNKEVKKSGKVIDCELKVSSESTSKELSLKTKEIIFLESKQEAFVKKIDKMLIINNNIYILDRKSKTILMFNKNGHYIRKLFNVGKGPKEYIHIQDVIMSNKGNIILLDNRMRKMLEYDCELNFLNEISFNEKIEAKAVHYFEQISEGYFAFYSITDSNRLTIFDAACRKEIFVYKDKLAHFINYTPLNHFSSPFYRMNGKLIFYEKYKDSIFQIDKTGVNTLLSFRFIGYDFFDISKLKDSKDLRQNTKRILNSGDVSCIANLYCIDSLLCATVNLNDKNYNVYYNLYLDKTIVRELTPEVRDMIPVCIDGNMIYSVLSPFNERHREVLNKFKPNLIDTLKFDSNYILEKLCIEMF